MELRAVGPNRYELVPQPGMRVRAVVYLGPGLPIPEEGALRQLAAAASLPGLAGPVVGMPDLHQGFGLPIGGVMACDAAQGLVSAGAVGMDINCGVRLLRTPLRREELGAGKLAELLAELAGRVPAGVGKAGRHREFAGTGLARVLRRGAAAVVAAGFGEAADLEHAEEGGALAGADPGALSREARERGDQLATLGGGNHFLEIGYVAEVYDPAAAEAFGLAPDGVTVLVHTGSRGLGQQVCTDYTRRFAAAGGVGGRNLAAVPIASAEGAAYLAAMAAAVNYAFANRQLLTWEVREAFRRVLGLEGLQVVYDVAHNIAKFEEHAGRRVLVHRKGATRALPPGHPGNPRAYLATGHPALVPGSMGTASYVVVGTPAAAETYYSVNHGAGRALSRRAARETLSEAAVRESLGRVRVAGRLGRLLDEAPAAYKDIASVVATLSDIGLTRQVARILPLAVLKGEGEEA